MLKKEHNIESYSSTHITTLKEFYNELMKLLATIEETIGLEICIYPSENSTMLQEVGINALPHSFFSHFGDFCRIVKANRTGQGCGGHDNRTIVRKSADIGKPFVNICHAGLSEVIFPVYGYNNIHIASVFIGQAITDDKGFSEIIRRVRDLGVDEEKLKSAYNQLPRISREKLLRIGKMADLAVKGMGIPIDFETSEHQAILQHYPAIRQTLRLIADRSWNISESEIAEKLNLHQSYVSRLFKKVMKCNFQSYIIRHRIGQAKAMLHHTDFSIMNIANYCGFTRQSYFTRQFKKITGMTPSEYRKPKKQR